MSALNSAEIPDEKKMADRMVAKVVIFMVLIWLGKRVGKLKVSSVGQNVRDFFLGPGEVR